MNQLNLKFKPLSHARWINNAELPVNEHFQLSISYNEKEGMWKVGDIGSYEVAIQCISNTSPYASLVAFEDTGGNIFNDCSEEDILNLVERAKTLEYAGEILIFDKLPGQKEPDWQHRFYCAKGYDLKGKLAYCKSIWGSKSTKYEPA